MPRLADHLRLTATRRFQLALVAVVDRTTPAVQRAFDSLDNYDETSVELLADRVAGPMQAMKSVAVRQAVGYYTILAGVRPPVVTVAEVGTMPDIRAPFISVWQALTAGHPLVDAVLIGRSRVEAVVSNFANSSARQTGDVFVAKANLKVRGWERTPDAGACAWCEQVAGQVYKTADSADFGHDRCVVGSTRVAATATLGLTRRLDVGEVVVLQTAAGDELAVTPNHPILTPQGWVPAGLLNVGGDVIRCTDVERHPGMVPDEYHMPARIEDRFGAFARGRLVRVPFAAEEFHGDGGDGDVDVVATDVKLCSANEPTVGEHVDQTAFIFGLGGQRRRSRLCRSHEALFGLTDSTNRIVRGGGLGGPLLSGHLRNDDVVGFLEGANRNTSLDQSTMNHRSTDIETSSQVRFTLSGEVSIDDLVDGQFHADGASRTSSFGQGSQQSTATDPDAARRLLVSLAGLVTVDRIVDLRRIRGPHQVFNLITRDGWYAANNIVTHNCGCTAAPIFE